MDKDTVAGLRELAECTVPEIRRGSTPNGTIPNPAFQALRGEHEWLLTVDIHQVRCCLCGLWTPSVWSDERKQWEERGPATETYCLRTDLGSLLDAIEACGFNHVLFFGSGNEVSCDIRSEDGHQRIAPGETRREAAAEALIAAVTVEPKLEPAPNHVAWVEGSE